MQSSQENGGRGAGLKLPERIHTDVTSLAHLTLGPVPC